MTEPKISLADRIRELRGTRISQNELAEKADLAPAALSRILAGERQVKAEHVLALASALDVTASELVDGTDASEVMTAWVPRDVYENSEAQRIEAEQALVARESTLNARDAENRMLKSQMAKLQSSIAELRQRQFETEAELEGEREARRNADHATQEANALVQRLRWALTEARRQTTTLQQEVQQSGRTQIATGVVAAALGALLTAAATAEANPPRRRR